MVLRTTIMEWNFILNWLFSKKKINKSIIMVLMMLAMSVLSACGSDIPDLTEEQMDIITDYSSALLLKYDSNAPSRLLPEGSVDLSIVFHDPDIAQPSEEMESDELNISGDIDTQVSNEDITVNDVTNPKESSHADGFGDFLSGSGLEITYSGDYEIVDTYPVENSNAYFATDASTGNKLLVMHFDINNISGEDVNVSMNSYGLRYRVSVNGGKNKNVMTTMLANDILSYTGTLAVGASEGLVAIAEIPENETDISSLVFTIRGNEFSTNMTLK